MRSSARAWRVLEGHILRGDADQERDVITRVLVLVPRAVFGSRQLQKPEGEDPRLGH